MLLARAGSANAVELYSTQFEAAEGFDMGTDLAGQKGWTNSGTGGNGLTDWNADFGYGLSGYVGYGPATTDGLFVWKPINHNPNVLPLVTVSFDVSLVDSSTTNRDEFRWSVYNIAGVRLFSLIFDNRDLGIYHQLDNNEFEFTGWGINNEDIYSVEIQMDFSVNRWNAWVGGVQVVTNEFITTTTTSKTFGDIDAVWLPGSPSGSGDNFMVFDNLTITASIPPSSAPVLDAPLAVGGGLYLIRVYGEEAAHYAVEASTNLTSWIPLKTNVVSSGYFDYLDTSAAGVPRRYYRARWVP